MRHELSPHQMCVLSRSRVWVCVSSWKRERARSELRMNKLLHSAISFFNSILRFFPSLFFCTFIWLVRVLLLLVFRFWLADVFRLQNGSCWWCRLFSEALSNKHMWLCDNATVRKWASEWAKWNEGEGQKSMSELIPRLKMDNTLYVRIHIYMHKMALAWAPEWRPADSFW